MRQTIDVDAWKVMAGEIATLGIDGKSVGNTTLYTVPAGRQLIVSRIVVIPTAVSAVIAPSTVSVGKTASAYADVIVAGALTGLTGLLTSTTLLPIIAASVLDAGESLVLRVSSGATATTYTLQAIVFGILL